MSACNEHKEELLRDYFLGRLDVEETEVFQFHLIHCAACRNELERMRRLAAGAEEDFIPAFNVEKPDGKKFRLVPGIFTRVAAVAGLLLLLAGGGYYFTYNAAEPDIPVEMDAPPVFHSGDSIVTDVDSLAVDTVKKEDWHVE